MILFIGIAAGLVAGGLRALRSRKPYRIAHLEWVGLVFLAFAVQWVAFSFPLTRRVFPDAWVPAVLVSSQVVLLVFAWVNRKLPGFWLLGLGLVLNLTVILLNGGMMPISPQTAQWLVPDYPVATLPLGERFGTGKDVLLQVEATRLWFLSDCLRTPAWLPFRVAFSLGDVMIMAGAFWLFWSLGGPHKEGS